MKTITILWRLVGFLGLTVVFLGLCLSTSLEAQTPNISTPAPVGSSGADNPPASSASQPVSDQPSVYIDISQGVGRKYNLAISELVSLSGAGQNQVASQVPFRLAANLSMTGLFNSLDSRSFLETNNGAGVEEGTAPDYPAWTKIGTDFLIKGGFSLSGSRLSLEMRLFDVSLGQQMFGKRYTGTLKDTNLMISRFTNDVLEAITGTPGVFGSEIIFVSALDETRKSIMLTALGGDDATQIAGYKGGPSTQPTMGIGNRKAWVHRNDKQWELLVDGKVISKGVTHLSPAFKPDGTVAAAMSGANNTSIYSFSGRNKTPLITAGGINVSPTFSPDGTQMAYATDQGGVVSIYVSPATGGAGVRLTQGKATDPSWSPTGEFITFVSRETDICIIRPDGTGYRQLTGGQGRNYRPSFSPDGRMIVFHSDRNGRRQLFVMAANGDMQQPLMPDYTQPQEQPYWSPSMPKL